jgi:uncharacterized protein
MDTHLNHFSPSLLLQPIIMADEATTTTTTTTATGNNSETKCNPVVYFEIPVINMDRAVAFYAAVFALTFAPTARIDGNDMTRFPFYDQAAGIGGALVCGDSYQPSSTAAGILVYFNTNDMDETLRRVLEQGGTIFYPKTSIGEHGWVAEFIDCEGNRLGLHCL